MTPPARQKSLARNHGDATPADPGLLTLEVTESIFVRDRDRAQIVLGVAHSLGVTVVSEG